MALEEQLDAAAEDAKAAVALALDAIAPLSRRPVDPVLGLELACRLALGLRPEPGSLAARSGSSGAARPAPRRWPRRSPGRRAPDLQAAPSTPPQPTRPDPPRAGPAWRARPAPAACQAWRRRRTAPCEQPHSSTPALPPTAPGRPGGRASSSAQRERGTRARARLPAPPLRSSLGCRQSPPVDPLHRSSPIPVRWS